MEFYNNTNATARYPTNNSYPVAYASHEIPSRQVAVSKQPTRPTVVLPKVYQHAPYGFTVVSSSKYPPPPPMSRPLQLQQQPPVEVATSPKFRSFDGRSLAPPAALGEIDLIQEAKVVRKPSALSDTASQHSTQQLTPEQRDSDDDESPLMQTVTLQSLQQCGGRVAHTACTSHGSSFLQYALRKFPTEAFAIVLPEVLETANRLVLDKNGCYVVKAVLEMMHRDEALPLLHGLAANRELLVSLCTKDLHSRRMVQFFLEFEGRKSNVFRAHLYQILLSAPMSIVRTQQGCITAQRILDHCSSAEKEAFFRLIRATFLQYALDPFGHYLAEYMLAEGDQVENSNTLMSVWTGSFAAVACNPNAATIVEKCFGLVTPALQRQIVDELFGGPEPVLVALLRNEPANYVIQAAIRAASYRDVVNIQQRIAHLLHFAAFSKKIQSRIQRRLSQGH